jgi:hypothetical protein
MQYIRNFFRNLAILLIVGAIFYIVAPAKFMDIYYTLGIFFYPAVLILVGLSAMSTM